MVESDETKDLRAFMTLFTFAKKADLERYAETVVVTQSAFARFVMACQDGSFPFKHAVHYSRSVSEPHLPSDTDLRALADNGVGPLGADAAKTVRKVGLFMRLGKWSAGHMFYTAGFYEMALLCLRSERSSRVGQPLVARQASSLRQLAVAAP